MSEWISVRDRLPEIGDIEYLMYTKERNTHVLCGREIVEGDYLVCTFEHSGFNSEFETVTHWMPLPAPPKGE